MKYIEFLPFLPLPNTFEYKSELNINIGDVLRCRFGRFDTLGIVISVHNTQQTKHNLASVSEVVFKNLLTPIQTELIKNLEKYYGYNGGLFAKLFFPFSIKNSKFPNQYEMVKLNEEANLEKNFEKIKSKKWQIIYNTLKHDNAVESSALTGLTPFAKKGFLTFFHKNIEYKNFQYGKIQEANLPDLSHAQQNVVDSITYNHSEFKTHLIHGKTGSGKTEVYAHLMQRVLAESEPKRCHQPLQEGDGIPEGSHLKQEKYSCITHKLQQGGGMTPSENIPCSIPSKRPTPQILILLPEIGLAKVIAQRLENRFNCKIPIWHSSTPENKRKEYFNLIQNGACNIVIGTRSALFLPFKNLKMIIVDEEHDGSYKQEEAPVYNARDVAVLYGKLLNIPIVLGSATPSVESYFNAQNGKYTIHELTTRFADVQMPKIKTINERSRGFLSESIRKEILEYYNAGKQILVFLNRRGFAPVNRCVSCDGIFKCSACDALLTYHKKKAVLTCHKCTYTLPLHSSCTMCGEDIQIKPSGAGVEAVHEEVVKLVEENRRTRTKSEPKRCHQPLQEGDGTPEGSHLKQEKYSCITHKLQQRGGMTPSENIPCSIPSKRPTRSDASLPSDCVLRSPSSGYGLPPHQEIAIFSSDEQNTDKKLSSLIENIQNGTVKIIIGTQIASKGYDFPNLKLVCIVDLILKNDDIDFKSDEKLMQLFTQVAGRGGRTGERGLVLVQSKRRKEEIECIMHENQQFFYEKELKIRQENFFPPFSRFIAITVLGKDDTSASNDARKIAQEIQQSIKCNIFGPAPAPIAFIKNTYRYKILLITHRSQLGIPSKLAEITRKYNAKIDVDTISFY